MVKMITLASGNTMLYLPETDENFSQAFIVDNSFNFVGGFLCDEADRKVVAFQKLQNIEVKETSTEVFHQFLNWCKFDDFAAKLGSASSLFLQNWHKQVSDLGDCDGTESRAESCGDRRHYYKAVGCERLYKSSMRFPLWALIANHVSVFSLDNFRHTFFRGHDDNPMKGAHVEVVSRYSNRSFQAPAAYIRAFCTHS